MTNQRDRATAFHALHVKGNPLVLFNMWDVGSAIAVAKAGAKALATGSKSVACAFGFDDGEIMPMALALEHVARIVAANDLPVTFDFEGAYAQDLKGITANTEAALTTGVVGFNFEDQIVGTAGIYSTADQAARITAMRRASESVGINAFINARTDIFLKAARDSHDESLLDEAIERAFAYKSAGASGFFAPGLVDLALITKLCSVCPLPVNIMAMADAPDHRKLAEAGVARISYGPIPWVKAMAFVEESARAALLA